MLQMLFLVSVNMTVPTLCLFDSDANSCTFAPTIVYTFRPMKSICLKHTGRSNSMIISVFISNSYLFPFFVRLVLTGTCSSLQSMTRMSWNCMCPRILTVNACMCSDTCTGLCCTHAIVCSFIRMKIFIISSTNVCILISMTA